jgi:hypothetical protein
MRTPPEQDLYAEYVRYSRIGENSPNPWIAKSSQILGWLYDREPEGLYQLAYEGPAGDVIEIGTWYGKSACILAGACLDRGDQSVTWCIDTFLMDGTEEQVAYHHAIHNDKGTFYHFLETAKKMEFYKAVIPVATYSFVCLPHLSVNARLVFIDARHDASGVLEDLALAVDKVVPGGHIVLHDCNAYYPDVQKSADAFFQERQEDWEALPLIGSLGIYRRSPRNHLPG